MIKSIFCVGTQYFVPEYVAKRRIQQYLNITTLIGSVVKE
jgi:hypothetical protein